MSKLENSSNMSEEKINQTIELIRRELFPNIKQIATLLSKY